MTKITPFKAIRPVRDKVHLVATRPYYTYKKNVLKAKLEDNPYTFLHIINPEFGNAKKTKPNSNERFQHVREKYEEFLADGILIQDPQAHIYIYRQTKDGHAFTGVVAGASIEEYENDLIKKHEATLTSREDMFVRYLDIIGFNAEPVLLSHPHDPEIDELLIRFTQTRPEYEFSTTDRIKHEVWILTEEESLKIMHAFEKLPATYIADGHHRSASSAGLKKLRENRGSNFPNEQAFLAFFIDESSMKILEFNRVVHTLNELSPDEFLQKLATSFTIKSLTGAEKPAEEHQITLCLEGKWYLLTCLPQIVDADHPVKCLDAEILTNFVLKPILGINDLKTDPNVEFISGVESLSFLEEKLTKGKGKAAFVLFPATIDQVKRVADHQLIMPPKSTWVEPKLRNGLTIYKIDE